MTTYAANTTYQIITHEGYDFLIKRIDWSTPEFPTDNYSYCAYERNSAFAESPFGRHSTVYHALGEYWGDIESYFEYTRFDHLPFGSAERIAQVRSYQAFRKAIADHLIEQAKNFQHRWLPLPFID